MRSETVLIEPVEAANLIDEGTVHPDIRPTPFSVTVPVTDTEVIAELRRQPDQVERDRYVGAALRIGVLSLRTASGHIDADAVREAGQKLLADLREVLVARGTEMTGEISTTLTRYFDPTSGLLPQRLERLLQKDGDLARILAEHVGADSSMLARTLADHLGEGSPLYKMLSPAETTGLHAQLMQAIEIALAEQRTKVLGQFSLDDASSALSRLLQGIQASNQALGVSLKDQIDTVMKDLSSDEATSAISRLGRLLQETNQQIAKHLTLDDDTSPLARLKRGLDATIEQLANKQNTFHAEVRTTLAALQARKEEAARSTRHGCSFEDALGARLLAQAQRTGDIHEDVGARPGVVRASKKGDFVTTLSDESPAPGARIAWEAKDNAQYTLARALEEITQARDNRQAQVGVFVFSAGTAPDGLEPITRYGSDLVVVWDAEDATTDLRVHLAYSVARSLATRLGKVTSDQKAALDEIDRAIRSMEKQVKHVAEFKKLGDQIQARGEELSSKAERMRRELEKELASMDEQVASLRAASDPGDR